MADSKDLTTFFDSLDRGFFMDSNKHLAYIDSAFPIGYGQTISQPSLVLFMTEKLNIMDHHKILEIGTGSGYQTAFLAEFGKEVYTIERIPALQDTAKIKLSELGYNNIHYITTDGTYGFPEQEPYDRIIVTAAATGIPDSYIEQLNNNGILIIPVGDSSCQELLLITKDDQGNLDTTSLELVRFVPLVGEYEIS